MVVVAIHVRPTESDAFLPVSGYTGYRCAGCEDGYFKRGGACFKCNSQSAHWLIIAAGAWGVLLLAGVVGGLMNALGYLENLLKLVVLLSIVFSVL